MELLRSLIFVPGNRRDMLEKARNFNADVIVADLEDSVPPGEKLNARQLVKEMAPGLSSRGKKTIVRLNSLDTGLTRDDLSAVIGTYLYGVSVGKAQSTREIQDYDRIISALEASAGIEPGRIKMVPWIENAGAVLAARELAHASARIVALAFGAEDYTDDMGVERTDGGEEFYHARATTAIAAKAAGVVALDTPYVSFRDAEGMRRDTELGLRLGYKGKFAIHPAQLETINKIFSPRPDEIDYARRIVEAWDAAETAGRGSTSLDGRMVDVPVVKRAKNLLAQAQAIANRN